MRLASRNQLSESDAQQVERFNNGIRFDIQAIISLQTSWTLDEAVRMALKAKSMISKGKSNSKFKSKSDLNQSLNQLGENIQPLNSNEADKNMPTYSSTSSQATKKPIYQYAWPVGNKCFKCQKIGHTSSQCRAKVVNVAERGELYEDEYENEECFI
ncbi:RNA-directed DNA polymerase [Tanacetum coccineum]